MDMKNNEGKTALVMADGKGHKETAEILRKGGECSAGRRNQIKTLFYHYSRRQLEERIQCLSPSSWFGSLGLTQMNI